MSSNIDALNVTEVIDRARLSRLQLWVICVCTLVIVLDGFDVQAIAFAGPAIAAEWQMATSALGPILGAGLVGMAVGALVLGPLGDVFGRKAAITVSVLTFGSMSLLTAWASNESQIMLLRFLTGLGLGGAMPNATALMAEYAPARLRNLTISIIFLGFPLGGIVGGLIAAEIIPVWGWRSVFIVGGVLPIVLATLILWRMPESVRFLVAKKAAQTKQIDRIMKRIEPKLEHDNNIRYSLGEASAQTKKLLVKHLFDRGYKLDTVLLWIVFFVNLLVIYFLISWLPTLMVESNFNISQATRTAVALNVGGAIGALVLAWLIARNGSRSMLLLFFVAGAISTILIGQVAVPADSPAVNPVISLALIMSATFFAGFFIFGAQIGMNVLAASIYPTYVRSTGVGWALGIGRIGSILGPVIGGILLGLGLGMGFYFLAFGLILLVAAGASFALSRHQAPVDRTLASPVQ